MCITRTIAERKRLRLRTAAFTLVELLIVVSIITLLIAVLIPSLQRARMQAKQAKCLANLGEIGKACMTYALDDPNNNVVPIARTSIQQGVLGGTFEWGGKSGRGGTGPGQHAGSMSNWASYWGPKYARGAQARPLNLTLYKKEFPKRDPHNARSCRADQDLDLNVYKCPADTGYTNFGGFDDSPGDNKRCPALTDTTVLQDSGMSCYDHYGNSYACNTFWTVYSRPAPGEDKRYIRSNSPYLHSFSRIHTPQSTILVQEANSRFAWRWGRENAGDGSGSGCNTLLNTTEGGIKGWHGRNWIFCANFCDGHAATIRMQGAKWPPPHLGATYPFCPNPSLYDCFRCVTIRGDGWQLDTLPSPSVPTAFAVH